MVRRSLIVSALVLAPVAALAQSNAEINAAIQFHFSPPGARSLGMGGAFLALADDATAAYANPAGLGVLTRPEISFEGRNAHFTSSYTDQGSAGTPSNIGIDNISGLVDKESQDSSSGPAFLSAVYPKGRFAVAVYRHELARFRASAETQGAYFDRNLRAFPTQSTMKLDVVNYGVSASFRASDALWLGVGVARVTFAIDSRTDRFSVNRRDPVNNDTRQGGFFGSPDYSAANLINFQTQKGDDQALAVTAGLIWRPSAKFQVAAVFRSGPDFDQVEVQNQPGPRASFTASSGQSGFKVPDSFGLGLVWRPTDRFLVAGDAVRVRHSQRMNHFIDAFGGIEEADPADFEVKDGTELHFGAEYVLAAMKNPLAFRAGVWLEPDSRIRWVGDPSVRDVVPMFFHEGDSATHVAAGLGWVTGRRFQLDGAADFSNRGNTFSVSAIVRF